MIIEIQSSQNSIIKLTKALHNRKFRDEQSLYFVEGVRFVEEAIKSDFKVQFVVFMDKLLSVNGGEVLLKRAQAKGISIYHVDEKLFGSISDTQNPQGIIAVLEKKSYDFYALIDSAGHSSLVILLEGLQDPGNLGTVIRTAHAAGAKMVIISNGCVDIYNPKALRATMGSVFHLPVILSDDFSGCINTLKQKSFKVIATHLSGTKQHFEADMTGRTAIVIGNEANGISDETVKLANELVRIPMPGGAESLNASIAAGVMIYEAVRQSRS